MRRASIILIAFVPALAQFKSTTQLVVTPVTVTDSHGHFIDGLTTDDLILTDNSVPQAIQMDWTTYPIDLVVAVQISSNSGPMIDKLGGSGILFSQSLAANAGQTAVISFSNEVKLRQDFTGDPDALIHTMRMFRSEGSDGRMLDALHRALLILSSRPKGRRRIVLIIAEKRDRGSSAKLPEIMAEVQKTNAAVYWLTYSPFLQPFTLKNKVAEDLKPEAERRKFSDCAQTPTWLLGLCKPDETPVPYEPGPGSPLYAIGELARLRQPDLASLFAGSTGGRELNFLKKNGLEQAVELISQEVHRQYILTFAPQRDKPGTFHQIRVRVKGKPDLLVTSRGGYWAVE